MRSNITTYCKKKNIAGTEAEYQSEAETTKDTPYITPTGELWDVFCEYIWENYNGTALYEDFRYKDKTVVRPSYLYNGNAYTGKTASFILRQPPWQPKVWVAEEIMK